MENKALSWVMAAADLVSPKLTRCFRKLTSHDASGQPGDLGLLGVSWSCVSAMRRRGGLAGNLQLPAGALGERLTVVG